MKRLWCCLLLLLLLLPCVSHALTLLGGSGGVGSIQDEGTPLGSFRTINCQGAGIECSDGGGGLLNISVTASGSSGLDDPGANGLVNRIGAGITAPYAGTSCTNQVLRVLSAAGAGTCATITSAYVDSSICTTAGVCSGYQAALGFTPENVTNKANGALSTSATTYPTSGAVKSYVDTLAATQEALANKSTDTNLGTSDTLYPTQNAVKTYVDTAVPSLTGGVGIVVSGTTISADFTEAGSLANGTTAALACGTTNGGKVQIGPNQALQYCDYTQTGEEEPLAPASVLHSGYLTQAGLSWNVDPATCTTDPNGGKLTLIANTIVCGQDLGGEDIAWQDGGTTSLTCSGVQGAHQVMNDGRLQYCGGEDVSQLYHGYLLPSPLSWNITAATCTGDTNGGKLTVNGSNQLVCAADTVGVGGGGSGDMTAVGNIASGDAGTTGFPLTALWFGEAAAPSAPAAGQGRLYLNATSKNFCVVSDNSTVKCGVQAFTPVANQFLTSIAADGSVSAARPALANLSDAASVVKLTDAQIVEGKQLVPRVCQLGATSGSVTPNADTCDIAYRHDVSGTVNVQTPTATGANPRPMQALTLSLQAAAAQAITWSSAYAGNYTIALPDTLPAGKYVAFTFRYNTTSTKYELWAAHVPDVAVSSILFGGSTSGVVTVAPQAAAGTYNLNLPTSAGSPNDFLLSGGGGATPMTWTAAANGTDTTAGVDTVKPVTPASLANSMYAQRFLTLECVADDEAVILGEGICYAPVPALLAGYRIGGVQAHVGAAVSSSGAVTVDIDVCGAVATGTRCSGTTRDLLSTNLTIDQNESGSETAATAAVIDTANDDLASGEWVRVNVDGAGVGTQGLYVTLMLRKP